MKLYIWEMSYTLYNYSWKTNDEINSMSIIKKYCVWFYSTNVFLLLACCFVALYFILISIFNYLKLSQNINETR